MTVIKVGRTRDDIQRTMILASEVATLVSSAEALAALKS